MGGRWKRRTYSLSHCLLGLEGPGFGPFVYLSSLVNIMHHVYQMQDSARSEVTWNSISELQCVVMYPLS
jgi:hypothetical protein